MTTADETLKQQQQGMFFIDIAPYVERGSRCVLWGKPVQDMSRGELIGVIGFLEASLDELSKLARGGDGMTVAAEAILRKAISDAAKGKGIYPETYRVDEQDMRGEPTYTIHGTVILGGIRHHWVGYIAKWRLSYLVLTEQWANDLVERLLDIGTKKENSE